MGNHRAGFVNIIGKPNVGKSTLMNVLVGEKLAAITPKAQTTRHRMLGMISGEDFQIVLSDTPGALKPHYKLHESMMKEVDEAIEDADIIILLTETGAPFNDLAVFEKLKEIDVPLIIAINKIDQSDQESVENYYKQCKTDFPDAFIIPLAAKTGFNIELLKKNIIEKLPINDPFYNKDELTDKPLRFFIAEIIRSKILLLFHKEVPYSVEVVIDEFKEQPEITKIKVFVFVARESQKKIILGYRGAAIKKLGTESRKEIEDFIGKKVFLDITVKVSKDWRDDPGKLKRFGYKF